MKMYETLQYKKANEKLEKYLYLPIVLIGLIKDYTGEPTGEPSALRAQLILVLHADFLGNATRPFEQAGIENPSEFNLTRYQMVKSKLLVNILRPRKLEIELDEPEGSAFQIRYPETKYERKYKTQLAPSDCQLLGCMAEELKQIGQGIFLPPETEAERYICFDADYISDIYRYDADDIFSNDVGEIENMLHYRPGSIYQLLATESAKNKRMSKRMSDYSQQECNTFIEIFRQYAKVGPYYEDLGSMRRVGLRKIYITRESEKLFYALYSIDSRKYRHWEKLNNNLFPNKIAHVLVKLGYRVPWIRKGQNKNIVAVAVVPENEVKKLCNNPRLKKLGLTEQMLTVPPGEEKVTLDYINDQLKQFIKFTKIEINQENKIKLICHFIELIQYVYCKDELQRLSKYFKADKSVPNYLAYKAGTLKSLRGISVSTGMFEKPAPDDSSWIEMILQEITIRIAEVEKIERALEEPLPGIRLS